MVKKLYKRFFFVRMVVSVTAESFCREINRCTISREHLVLFFPTQ
uniref:Uncharacterized protein n=1 Tax=Anguilla anguilla TaxID=7936 RepID=A0A0E9QT19_ANGAN